MEQTREHNLDNQNRINEEKDYAMQTMAITQMRQIMEDDAAAKKKNMVKELQQYNQMLAQEKRDREAKWFQDQ